MTLFKPPQNPGKLTIALFGENSDLMNKIGSKILQGHNTFEKNLEYFELREDASFRLISALNFFDEKCQHPDQKIIDFMALSDQGPHRFVLAMDSENTPEDKIMNQMKELKKTFGKTVTKNVVIISENQLSHSSFKCVKEMQNIQITTVHHDLASELREWSPKHQPFQFDYRNYSHDTVKRRKGELESTSDCSSHFRNEVHPQNDSQTRVEKRFTLSVREKSRRGSARKDGRGSPNPGSSADGSSESVFNIVLLGKGGTGKSASGNTILAAGNSHLSILSTPAAGSSPEFKSCPSSTPVTTKCEARTMKLGMQVRVVDTPDFFCDEEQVEEAQLEECKKYCQEGQCVLLLVIQLGRFTEGERGILEKLEEKLGWRIREKTIVLFTHGDDLNVEVEKFIGERSHLKHIVEACGDRYHVFKNTSRDSKQVVELTEKFTEMCPNFTPKKSSSQCCLC